MKNAISELITTLTIPFIVVMLAVMTIDGTMLTALTKNENAVNYIKSLKQNESEEEDTDSMKYLIDQFLGDKE